MWTVWFIYVIMNFSPKKKQHKWKKTDPSTHSPTSSYTEFAWMPYIRLIEDFVNEFIGDGDEDGNTVGWGRRLNMSTLVHVALFIWHFSYRC